MTVPSYLGRRILWLDEAQQEISATITRHVRDGATSSVWQSESGQGDPRRWVVKIPFQRADLQVEEFLPELEVMAGLRDCYRSLGQAAPVPECYRVEIDGLPCLVMPYYEVEWQAMLARDNDPDFLSGGFYHLALAAVDLFQHLHVDQKTYTHDIKDENFYWLPRGVPLVLDWNRCKRVPGDGRAVIAEANRLLARAMAVIYIGGDLPNPLPERVDAGWPDSCPRALRRLLLESSRPGGVTVERMVDLLKWMQRVEEGCLEDALEAAWQVKGVEGAERVLDCAAYYSPGQPLPEPLEFAAAEARKILNSPRERLNETVQVVQNALLMMDTGLAVQQCERVLRDRALPPADALRVIELYAPALVLNGLRDAGDLTMRDSEMYADALKALRGSEAVPGSLKPSVARSVKDGRQVIGQLQAAARDIQSLLDEQDPTLLSALFERVQVRLKELRTEAAMYALAVDVLAAQLLLVDLPSLRRAEKARQIYQAALKRAADVEQRCVNGLRDNADLQEIRDLAYTAAPTFALRRLTVALGHFQDGNWQAALSILARQDRSPVLSAARERLKRELSSDLQSHYQATLYPRDLARLHELRAMGMTLPRELVERLSAADNLPEPQNIPEERIKQLQKARIEPYTNAPDKENCTANLLEAIQLKALKKDLNTLEAQVNSSMERLRVEKMKELEDLQRKITEAQVEYNEQKIRIDTIIQQVDTDIKTRLGEIDSIKTQIANLDGDLGKQRGVHQRELETLSDNLATARKNLNEGLAKMKKELEDLNIPGILDLVRSEENSALTTLAEVQKVIPIARSVAGELNQAREELEESLRDLETTNPPAHLTAWLQAITTEMLVGHYDRALRLCDALEKDTGAQPEAREAIKAWKDQAGELRASPDWAKWYQAWAVYLRNKNEKGSAHCLRTGAGETGKPLYMCLAALHNLQFGLNQATGPDEMAQMLEKDRKKLLETIEEMEKQNGMTMVTSFWRERLEQLNLAEYILTDARSWKPNFALLGRTGIPSQVWSIANENQKRK